MSQAFSSAAVVIGALRVKCSKIGTLFCLFSNKKLFFRAEIHKMLVRIANREDPIQTASSEAVWSGSALLVLEILEHITSDQVLNC